MDAISQDGKKKKYTTPRWVQVWFLQRSRDNWKEKYKQLRRDAKRMRNRVHDVTRSREQWREQTEQQEQRIKELEAENAVLREQAAKKNSGCVMGSREADPPPASHGYGAEVIGVSLRLIQAGVSLRCVPRVLETVCDALGWALLIPHWTTGRLWLLRLGHAVLNAEKKPADDWAWLIDHSVQIGQEKCLVIVGIRLADLPPRGQSLRHEDLKLIALLPAKSWTGFQVDQALEQAAVDTGHTPRVIVDDHGADINGGVVLFQQRHSQTVEIYDTKHKAACLLKRRLENDQRWREFQTAVGQTRCAVQQTELAFLVPPGPKPKARFMNLGMQLKWARRMLAILREPPSSMMPSVSTARLNEKLGWIEAFAAEVSAWSQWQQVIDITVTLVSEQGLHQGLSRLLAQRLSEGGALCHSARVLAAELIRFVRWQEGRTRPDERFPGSTEILESCFGKFKQLEKQQSRGGFTQLLLGFGALLTRATTDTVREAMQTSRTADIRTWAKQTLGVTLFAQRQRAFACATNMGRIL